MTSTGRCRNAMPPQAAIRIGSGAEVLVRSERIQSPKALRHREIDRDEHDRYDRERGGERHVSGGALLLIDHHANEISRRADYLRDDVVAEREREREHGSRGDAGHGERYRHVPESLAGPRAEGGGGLEGGGRGGAGSGGGRGG